MIVINLFSIELKGLTTGKKQSQLSTQALEDFKQNYHCPILFITIDNTE